MSSFDLLLLDESEIETKVLSKKALKKLQRKGNQLNHSSNSENELKKLHENDGVWFTIIEFLSMNEIMLTIVVLSRRDSNIVDSQWCQSTLLTRGMELFHTLSSKDWNSTLNSLDHKQYFGNLRKYEKKAKRKKQPIEDNDETNLERKKIFKRLYLKLREEHNNRMLTLHNSNQAIRSEIQAEFQNLRSVWSSLITNRFECFHDEFKIEDSISDEEKQKITYDLGSYYRFTCKKCGIVAISNYMPVFGGTRFITPRGFGFRRQWRPDNQEFKLLNIFNV